jgi:uncharacterized lipoprotein YmbA
MTGTVRALTTVGLLTLLTCGCLGRIKYPSYYTLSIAPELKQQPASAGRPITVAVQRFATPPYLRQGRIVYRQGPDQVDFYEYHRWASDPGAAVTTALVEGLRSTQRISLEEPAYGKDQSDYVLSGRLERLDEIDYDGGVKVQTKLSAELKSSRTGAVVWTGEVTRESTVNRRDVKDVVQQMSNALQASVDELLGNVERKIAETDEATR